MNLLEIIIKLNGQEIGKSTTILSESLQAPVIIQPELPIRLTNSELKVAHLIAMAMTTKAISEALGVSYRHVDNVRRAIRKKMGLERGQSINQELAKYRLPANQITL